MKNRRESTCIWGKSLRVRPEWSNRNWIVLPLKPTYCVNLAQFRDTGIEALKENARWLLPHREHPLQVDSP